MKVAIYSYKLTRIKVSNIKLIVFTLSLSLELLRDTYPNIKGSI